MNVIPDFHAEGTVRGTRLAVDRRLRVEAAGSVNLGTVAVVYLPEAWLWRDRRSQPTGGEECFPASAFPS